MICGILDLSFWGVKNNMKIQEQDKQSRPSLYGSQPTTSTFSVLGAITPMGWSKQHVVLASVASFMVGGVMGGSVVGFVQQPEQMPAVSTITLPSANVPAIQQPIQQTIQQSATDTVAASALPSPPAANVSQPISPVVAAIEPLSNPLASFKTSADKEIYNQDRFNKKITAPKNTTPSHKSHMAAANDDLAMQKLIENKSINARVHEKNLEQRRHLEKDDLRKESLEKTIKSDQPIKNIHTNKENNQSKSAIKLKKDNARDKDVLLVKSMLDTMDHSAAKNKNPQTTINTTAEIKK